MQTTIENNATSITNNTNDNAFIKEEEEENPTFMTIENRDKMGKLSQNNNKDISDEDDDDDTMSVESNDSCKNLISLRSIRNRDDLEEAVTFTYPGLERTIRLSTLLEPDDLAPLFAGAQWAGTRVWRAAIRAAHYLATTYPPNYSNNGSSNEGTKMTTSLLELGCGLGVPGMIYHALGGSVVLTDQEEVMSQLEKNVEMNFTESYTSCTHHDNDYESNDTENTSKNDRQKATIQALPLNWSRPSLHKLLSQTTCTSPTNGFDIVLNCDCIYEPLYGKSWMYLAEVIDECLKINPKCVVLTSVERRNGDGVDKFLKRLIDEEKHVGSVSKILEDQGDCIEMYLCTGCL